MENRFRLVCSKPHPRAGDCSAEARDVDVLVRRWNERAGRTARGIIAGRRTDCDEDIDRWVIGASCPSPQPPMPRVFRARVSDTVLDRACSRGSMPAEIAHGSNEAPSMQVYRAHGESVRA